MRYIVIIAVIFLAFQFRGEIFNSSSFESSSSSGKASFVSANNQDVVLYGTQSCGYCKKVRTMLRERGIPYADIDVQRSAEGAKRFKELNGNGVPLMVIRGEVIRGYNETRIKQALSRL
ncbi:MAG TPA: glutaredoxin family protein [Cellvibrionaceae bacterium]